MAYRLFKRKIGKEINYVFNFDVILTAILTASLILHYLKIFSTEMETPILIVIAYAATLPVIWNALKVFKTKKISVDMLASIALIASLVGKEWTSAIFINLMISSARIFSDYTENRSRRAIESLLKMKPRVAKIKIDGGFQEIRLDEVKKGDLVLVELGKQIPVDGVVEKGEAEVNQASLTGESLPVLKKDGDKVLSSSIVESGTLIVRAEKVGKETFFEKIINLVESAHIGKARISTLSDKFSEWYIVTILIVSILLYYFSQNLTMVLAMLLVSCADDVAIAIPLAFLSSIAHNARHGAVVKGGDYIEALAKAEVFVFDKTGTLTKGKQKVENFEIFENGFSETEFLKLSGIVSEMSSHPSAKAIINLLKEKKIATEEPDKFREISGKGSEAILKEKRILAGKLSYLQESGVKFTGQYLEKIKQWKDEGLVVSMIAVDKSPIGFFVLADEIRPHIPEIIAELREEGAKRIVMLTGDNEKIAKRVADKIGVTEFHANLLPEDKLTHLKKYLSPKYRTVMVGDGVNDAANLALADIGIAMGVIGTDAAIESADIALMNDDLRQLPEMMRISRRTLKVIHQDLFVWGLTNAIGLILVFTGAIGPAGAAAYNFITDFLPIMNSFRLLK